LHFVDIELGLSRTSLWHSDCEELIGRGFMMRVTIGLIGLSLVGGVVPTGLAGITHAAQVLAGTAGALLSLLLCCLAGAVASRRPAAPTVVPVTPRRQLNSIAPPRSVPRTI
jgi:hypothetical protein